MLNYVLQVIRNHTSSLKIYEQKLLESGEMTQDDIDMIHRNITSVLNEEFLASKEHIPKRTDWLSSHWSGFKSPEQLSRIRNTGYVHMHIQGVRYSWGRGS